MVQEGAAGLGWMSSQQVLVLESREGRMRRRRRNGDYRGDEFDKLHQPRIRPLDHARVRRMRVSGGVEVLNTAEDRAASHA
jgi:hypothetical protein